MQLDVPVRQAIPIEQRKHKALTHSMKFTYPHLPFRPLLILFVLFCTVSQGHTAEPPPPSSEINLAGDWRFFVDKSAQDGSATFASPAFDDAAWTTQQVPGKWVYQGFPNYQGKGWYRTRFVVPETWQGQPIFLQLPPADQSDRTYLNGQPVGAMKNKPRSPRIYPLSPEVVKWGSENVLAVEITSKVGNGGFAFGAARLIKPGPFIPVARPANTRQPLDLQATTDLASRLSEGKTWITGWHDKGTTDTRMGVSVQPGPGEGTSALGLDVRFPNCSGEFVDFRLPNEINGSKWRDRGDDYLSFSYQTDDLAGEMRIHLNAGNFRFGTGGGGYSTSFRVQPGGWTHVVIPFAEFVKRTHKSLAFMPDTSAVNAISIGYKNNELHSAGKIRLANFMVGRLPSGMPSTVPLDGLWRFSPEGPGQGLAAGWEKPGFDTSGWAPIMPGQKWQAQGFRTHKGPGWFIQQAFVPADWAGLSLRLQAGKVLNGQDNGELFFNGTSLGQTTKWDKDIDFLVPKELVLAGALNVIAIRLTGTENSNGNGLDGSPFVLEPLNAWVELREAGTDHAFSLPQQFDPGPNVGNRFEIALRIPKIALADRDSTVTFELMDCFFRQIAEGNAPLQTEGDKPFLQATATLTPEQSQRLYFSEFFDLRLQVRNAKGAVIYAATQRNVPLSYQQRDNLQLPVVAETSEDTPYGRLKLVDVVDASLDPSESPHPYKEGGIRGSWVGRIGYATWQSGIKIGAFQGKRYREANNSEWFGYRVGRNVRPGAAYLVRIEYPEDKTRYFPVNIDAGRNYQGLGFKTGVSPENPFDNYPLRKGFAFYDVLVIPDKLTYGSPGSRSVPADKGFWIFFHDIGRAYASQYDSGPAVSQIRVYEIPDLAAHYPVIRLPEGLPQRTFLADWEREPEFIPKDMVAHARFSGYNAISPETLKWGNLAFWRSKELPLKVVKPLREPLPDGELSAYEQFLEATREGGIKLFPRLEYGGSDNIPRELRAVAASGKPAKPNRFHTWCSDLLQPIVTQEITALFQEIVGANISKNPQIGGVMFRIRSDRLPISFSRFDVEMFSKETKTEIPADLDDTALAKWASSGPVGKSYVSWWHGKRRDFHQGLTKALQAIRPDLQLLYYNWDGDNWNLGKFNRGPQDFTDAYNVHTSRRLYDREATAQAKIAPEVYADKIRNSKDAHHAVWPELYSNVKGFALLGPVNWRYLADNPTYLNYFRTGDQLALTKIFNYEEKGRWNVQGDNYESSEMSTGGPDFAMAEQVLSVFHGDPWILTETTYTYGQGFLDAHRRFAQAFLALPALPGVVVEKPTGREEPDLRVRVHKTDRGSFLSAAHRGHESAGFRVKVPGTWTGKELVTDLVTGKPVPASIEDGLLVFDLPAPPMSLQSFRIE